MKGIKDLALYAKGVSMPEIQDHWANLYGIDVSRCSFRMDQQDRPPFKESQSIPFQNVHAVVFLDSIHYT